MKKYEKLEKLGKEIEELGNSINESRTQLESLVDLAEVENAEVIKASVEDPSDIEEVSEKVRGIQKVTRKVGQRFFNLFKVTFTVQFAGVTLIHFTIPRISTEDNENK